MIELLSPAGSAESAMAAVQTGANAIYLGYGDFNARRNAKNFTLEELEQTIDHCHVRGVQVFLTLNTLLSQRELEQNADTLHQLLSLGLDAVIIQDLGVADAVAQIAPNLPRHASTQCTIHSLEGVYQMAELGFSRVVLSRELSQEEIAYIAEKSPLELEVFVHGAMCMSYSGQCYFSAMVGERSGNRGLCAQPCRLDYGWDQKQGRGTFPLSLKDMSLAHHLQTLEDLGIDCLKIEGRMKRPEYVAVVTGIYSKLLAEKRGPTKVEEEALELAFSRQGFTEGYFLGETGTDMFGTRKCQKPPQNRKHTKENTKEHKGCGSCQREKTTLSEEEKLKELFAQARSLYQGKEQRKIPIAFDLVVEDCFSLTLTDPEGRVVSGEILEVEPAQNKALTPEVAVAQLQRTGGTAFTLEPSTVHVGENLALPLSKINHLRRDLLLELESLRQYKYPDPLQQFNPVKAETGGCKVPVFTAWVQNQRQITPELCESGLAVLYVPLDISEDTVKLCHKHGTTLSLQLPLILSDKERKALAPKIKTLQSWGITKGIAGTWDSLHWGKSLGLTMAGDFGLGIGNNQSLRRVGETVSLTSIMPSYELKFPQIRDLDKKIPMELLIYGNLPLMLTKNSMIANEFGKDDKAEHCLTDRKGISFPVERAEGNRNQIFNAVPLYLADKQQDWGRLGLWAGRLLFTRETPEQCLAVLAQYKTQASPPKQFTRGLYYRGVE